MRAADYGTAAIVHTASVDRGLYTPSEHQIDKEGNKKFEQYTDLLLTAQAEGKVRNAGTFLADAQKLRIAAFTGQEMPADEVKQLFFERN